MMDDNETALAEQDFPDAASGLMDRVLTEGFRQAAAGIDIGQARVAMEPGVLPDGPVRSGTFAPEEREEIVRGLTDRQA